MAIYIVTHNMLLIKNFGCVCKQPNYFYILAITSVLYIHTHVHFPYYYFFFIMLSFISIAYHCPYFDCVFPLSRNCVR